MKTKVLVFLTMLLALTVAAGCSQGAKEESGSAEMKSSGPMKVEEAQTTVGVIIPGAEVLAVEESPIGGLWEVTVETPDRRKAIVYLDTGREYLLAGQLLDIENKRNLTREKMEEISRVDVSEIPLEDALIVGNPDAEHKVIVFDDPDCPYCAKLHPTLKEIAAERQDVAFFIKLYPLVQLHPEALKKSKAILCGDTNAERLQRLEDAFKQKPLPEPDCETEAVEANLDLGASMGIDGTPTLVFPDGSVESGAIPKGAILDKLGLTVMEDPQQQ